MFGNKQQEKRIENIERAYYKLFIKFYDLLDEVEKLKHPAKYKIGDTLDGGIVSEVKFEFSSGGSSWIYRIVKDGATQSIYQKIER